MDSPPNSTLNSSSSKKSSKRCLSDLSCFTGAVILLLFTCYQFYYLSAPFVNWPSWSTSKYSSRELRTEAEWINRVYNELRDSNTNGSFATQMRSFPWNSFKSAVDSRDPRRIQQYYVALLKTLVPFVAREPLVPLNKSCQPPPLTFPPIRYIPPVPCLQLRKPRKVGVLINFGFDADALEIHMQELDALVDKFFILEANQPHNFYVSGKPSIWDLVKFSPRFSPFFSKVVHFVVDDANSAATDQLIKVEGTRDEDKDWREKLEVRLRWEKFLEWNSMTKFFALDDILGFGDTDEIPNRNNIYFLKYCEFPAETFPVDIGIWYPYPFLNTAVKSDFPVRGHPFTLGDPTYWTLRSAMSHWEKNKEPPKRNVGKSPGYMLGGIHLSKYAYMPFSMVKQLVATPTFLKGIEDCIDIGMMYKEKGDEANDEYVDNEVMHFDRKRQIEQGLSLAEFKKEAGVQEVETIMKIPWFINCNRARYPALEDKYDSRLDGLSS